MHHTPLSYTSCYLIHKHYICTASSLSFTWKECRKANRSITPPRTTRHVWLNRGKPVPPSAENYNSFPRTTEASQVHFHRDKIRFKLQILGRNVGKEPAVPHTHTAEYSCMSCWSNCGNAFLYLGCTSAHVVWSYPLHSSSSSQKVNISGHTLLVCKPTNLLLHENFLQPERLLVLHSIPAVQWLSGPVVVRWSPL